MKLEDLMSPEAYAQFKAAIDKANAGQPDKTKHVRFADLSEGGYVSRDLMGCPTGLSYCRAGTLDWWRSRLRVNVRNRCRFHGTSF